MTDIPMPIPAPGGVATLSASLASRAGTPALASAVRPVSVLLVTLLTAAAAQVSIPLPFTPVPFTLQPMIVLLGGAVLGARLGAASQLLYLAAGLAGLPVFAASPLLPPGLARLLGPTGGYLLAYPFAAALTGFLAERGFDRRYLGSVLAMTLGLAAIFAGGVAWLAVIQNPLKSAVGLDAALRAGFYPFVPADILKVCVAAGVMPALWRVIGRSQ